MPLKRGSPQPGDTGRGTRNPCGGEPDGFFVGAPGRAHVLGGESPLHTRQGEVSAERQGCRGRLRIRRKL